MSTLRELLSNNHPLLLATIARLEKTTGGAGIDVRLIGEISALGTAVVRRLGLDPRNTTSPELYAALKAAVKTGTAEQLLAHTSYVLVSYGDGPISLNLHDAIDNYHHELPFKKRSVAYGQRRLRAELIQRYAKAQHTNAKVVQRLAKEAGLVAKNDAGYAMYDKKPTEKEPAVPSVVTIGDIATDVYIKLADNTTRLIVDNDGERELSLAYGQKTPYQLTAHLPAAGCSANAAVALSRLGVTTSILSGVGTDQASQDSLQQLVQEHVNTDYVAIRHQPLPNYHYILWFKAERTILTTPTEQQPAYRWQQPRRAPSWFYLTEINDGSWALHQSLLQYLQLHPTVKLAFQPSLVHFAWGVKKLAELYRHSELLVLNREEAMQLTELPATPVAGLLVALSQLGPKKVVITDGPEGAYGLEAGQIWQIPAYPDTAKPYERTGAGDAYAATIVAALAQGQSLPVALQWAGINSASVVQKIGAQAGLLNQTTLQAHLKKAPAWYHASKVSL